MPAVWSPMTIRSLAISQRLLGTREIILIHHTDCGMLTFTDDDFKRRHPGRDRHQAGVGGGIVLRRGGGRPAVPRAGSQHPVRPLHTALRGFVFDVATGKLHEVTL